MSPLFTKVLADLFGKHFQSGLGHNFLALGMTIAEINQGSSNRISLLVGHYFFVGNLGPLIILAIRSLKTCRFFFPEVTSFISSRCAYHTLKGISVSNAFSDPPPPTTNAKLAGVFPLAKGYVSSFKLRISQRCCEAIMSFLEHMPLPISYIITHD